MVGMDGVSRAMQEWLLSLALPCWPFDLLSLNEVYRRELMLSITLYPLRYFDNFWHVYIYQVKPMCPEQKCFISIAGHLSHLP